jgi:hypothetical protein
MEFLQHLAYWLQVAAIPQCHSDSAIWTVLFQGMPFRALSCRCWYFGLSCRCVQSAMDASMPLLTARSSHGSSTMGI